MVYTSTGGGGNSSGTTVVRLVNYWDIVNVDKIGRDLAAHLNNPMIHRGFAVTTNKLHEELTIQELVGLSREEKDAMNATMTGMNNIGLLAKHGHLSQ